MYPEIPPEDNRMVHPALAAVEGLAEAKLLNTSGALSPENSNPERGGAAQLFPYGNPSSADGPEPAMEPNRGSVEEVGSGAEGGKDLVPFVAAKIGGTSSALGLPLLGSVVPDQPLNVEQFDFTMELLMDLEVRFSLNPYWACKFVFAGKHERKGG